MGACGGSERLTSQPVWLAYLVYSRCALALGRTGWLAGWLMLCLAVGARSNTLQVETSPGAGDFHAVELETGQGVRFNGNKCRHYTLPNATPHTRVSFDFRAVPKKLYRSEQEEHLGPRARATRVERPYSLHGATVDGPVALA